MWFEHGQKRRRPRPGCHTPGVDSAGVASIHKRPDGSFQVRYRDPAGRNRARTFDRHRDARAFRDEVEVDKNKGRWVDPTHGKRLLEDWVNEWWASTAALRPSSRARDESYLRTHVMPRFGEVPLAAITQLDVRAWVADLGGQGLAPATVAKAYQTLAKVMDAAVEGGLLFSSPCRRVPLPRVEREEMRFCTPDDIARLADAIHERYRALVIVAAYGGLRLSELAGLRVRNVDLLKSSVRVAEQAVEVRGHLHVGPPKTKASIRTVPLPRPATEVLAAHVAAHAHGELVFPGRDGGVLRANAWRRRFWYPACDAAGLGVHEITRDKKTKRIVKTHYEGLRTHDLRHTYAALLIATGASPLEVTRRMGHTSTSVVLDRYGHLFPAQIDTTTERLAGMWVAGSPDAAVRNLFADGAAGEGQAAV